MSKVPRRRVLVALTRGVALSAVCVLFATLVYRIVHTPTSGLVESVKAHRLPPAPNVKLTVIWPDARTWPAGLRASVRRGTLRLSDLRGYPVVVNFWASWCSPCQREAALLAAAAEARRGRVVFIGVDIHDLTSDARRFLRVHDVPYVAARSDGSIAQRFGLIGLPETFYVDRRGRVQNVTRGELSASTFDQALERISREGRLGARRARRGP